MLEKMTGWVNLTETQATTFASQQVHGNIVQEEGEQSISFFKNHDQLRHCWCCNKWCVVSHYWTDSKIAFVWVCNDIVDLFTFLCLYYRVVNSLQNLGKLFLVLYFQCLVLYFIVWVMQVWLKMKIGNSLKCHSQLCLVLSWLMIILWLCLAVQAVRNQNLRYCTCICLYLL